jgi:hypothetical protein
MFNYGKNLIPVNNFKKSYPGFIFSPSSESHFLKIEILCFLNFLPKKMLAAYAPIPPLAQKMVRQIGCHQPTWHMKYAPFAARRINFGNRLVFAF